jgi:hypothetical protein
LKEVAEYQELDRYKASIKTASVLRKYGIITSTIYDKIEKVISICNKGVHGELVNQEYVDYVKTVIEEISKDFDHILSEKPRTKVRGFVVCSRSGYKGDAEYNNVCPKCGFISDEY